MEYILESNYRMFLLEQISEQQKMERYIQECIIFSEGKDVYKKIGALNEGVSDKVSEWWQKFKAFIARIWGKFIENVTKFATSDKGYCERYKDIILKKPLKEEHFPIEMRPCNVGITRIVNKKLPMYSTNMLDKINLTEGDKNLDFKKMLLHDYNGDKEFQDFAKDYFIGGAEEQKYESHAINMTDLYNFVTTFDKITANIKTDHDNLNKAVAAIEMAMKKQTPKPATNTNTQNTNTSNQNQQQSQQNQNTQQSNTQNQNNNQQVKESFGYGKTYSVVYETYITELQTADNKGGNGSTTSTPAPNNNLNSSTKNNVDKAHDTSSENQRQAALNKENDQSIEQKGRIYSQIGMQFLTAKMTAAEFIKKEYMAIIKMHVGDYVGKNDTKDTAAQSSTDYQNKVQPLNDADKANILAQIQNIEAMKEGDDKEAMKRSVVIQVRNGTNNTFTGDYNAAKELVGYKAK